MNLLFVFLIVVQTDEIPESEYGLEIRPVVDYEAGLVYYEKWVDSTYLGVAAVQTLEGYLSSMQQGLSFEQFKERLRERSAESEAGGVEGIIPDIKIQMGKERTDVKVSGQDRITMGSSASFYKEQYIFEEEEGKTGFLSGIELKQELDVSVKGVIARKTEVVIDHRSGGTGLTDANKVRIAYTGDEDEIVKKIEAGDVALNLPSHQALPAHQGLFGINTQAKVGPIDIYAVASREQTRSGTKEFTGQSESQQGEIMDRNYRQRRYFYVFHQGLRDTVNQAGIDNKNFLVYLDEGPGGVPVNPDGTKKESWKGSAWLYPNDMTVKEERQSCENFYLLVGGVDYELRSYREGWVIELKKKDVSSNGVLAVACKNSSGTTYGRIDTVPDTDSVVANLLLVWPESPNTTSQCWTNMHRNHYDLPGKLGGSEIQLEVYHLDNGMWVPRDGKGNRYSYLLGLTTNNSTNIHKLTPDEQRLGELIFEDLYPFTSPALGADTVHEIYWTRNLGPEHGGVYKIAYEYESLVQSYTLDPLIEENSVEVWVNGEKLDSTLYNVDYNAGTVTILKALQKTDELKITYEAKEILSLDRKSLLGLRAESELAEGVKLGGSFLFRKVGYSLEGRPVLGLEPFSCTIGELDLGIERKLGFLTRWIDRLPLVSTEAPSQFNLSVNSAVSMPNPNTHKSGAVWLDDFESTKETRSVGLSTPADWYTTSLAFDESGLPLDTALYSRRRPRWRLQDIPDIRKEIYAEETPIGQVPQPGSAFRITWNPEDTSYWTGIIGSTYPRLPLDITEAENLELILKTTNAGGRIHFEFGSEIDEDQLRWNADTVLVGIGYPDKEDKDNNNEYSNNEDTGLDGVPGVDSLGIPDDDRNDDYSSSSNSNGTERNGRLDSEDLLRDGWNNTDNDYYSFTLDLKDTALFSEYVDDLGESGWIKVSVPLGDTSFYVKHGSPDKFVISMFRIWFDGMDDDIDILLYSWDFAGNKWKDAKVVSLDSTEVDTLNERVFIGVIGSRDPGYTTPFKRGKTSTGQTEEDNSLRIRYENIASSHGAKASRWDYTAEDLRGYQRIKLYVHNDANDPLFYLRMGTDSMSYYEVRSRISEGELPPEAGDAEWREFTFELEDLAKLKVDFYDSLRYRDSLKSGVTSEDDPRLRVSGVPSFEQIKYFELGLVNDAGGGVITGEVWFNDIRLQGPYREVGTKLSANSSLVLADVGRVSANYSRDDGKFIDFISPQGPRKKGKTHRAGVSGNVNVEKFGLDRLGFKLPLNFGYSLTRSLPRYSAEITDYILEGEELEVRGERSDVKTLSFSASHPQSKSRLMKYTLDAIRASANYKASASNTNAGLGKDTSFTQNYEAAYSVAPDLYFTIFEKEKIRYFPNSINLSANFDKANSVSWYRSSVQDTWYETPVSNSSMNWAAGASYSLIQYLPITANYSETRSLKGDSIKPDIRLDDLVGSEYTVRTTSLTSGIKNINLNSFGRPSVSVSSSFTENRSQGVREQYVNAGYEDEPVRNLNNNGTVRLAWGGFDPNGLIADAKSKVEANLRELREQMRESARDSLEEIEETGEEIEEEEEEGAQMDSLPPDTLPPDSLSADTLFGDTLYRDTLPMDSLPMDSLLTDTLSQDSLPSDSLDGSGEEGKEPELKLSPEERLYEDRLSRLGTIGKVTGIFMPLSADVTFSRSSGYGFYTGDFDWAREWDYIVGLSDVIVSESLDTLYTHSQPKADRGWNQSYKVNSGLSLFGVVASGSVGYDYSENTQYSGRLAYNNSWTLPSVSVSYNKIGELLKKWANSSQLRMSVSHILTQKGEIYDSLGVDTILPTEEYPDTTYRDYSVQVKDTYETSTQLNFSPLISWTTSWKAKVNTDFSINYGIENNHNTYGGQDVSTEKITRGGLVSVGYTFNKPSGFKLSFLRHIKFKNDLSLTGTLNYNETLTRSNLRTDPETGEILDLKNTTTSGTVHAQYTFSDAFDGGANFTVTKFTDSDKSINDRTDAKLDVFVVFKF